MQLIWNYLYCIKHCINTCDLTVSCEHGGTEIDVHRQWWTLTFKQISNWRTCKIEFQATENFSRNVSNPTSIMNLEIWHQVPLYCTLSSRETSVSCWIFLDQRWMKTLNYWINNSSIPRSLRGASLRVKMSHPSSLLASPRSVTCEGPSKCYPEWTGNCF